MDILQKEKKLDTLINELHRLDDEQSIQAIKETIERYKNNQ